MNKKFSRKLSGMAGVLALAVSLTAVPAYVRADEPVEYSVWIGGEQVTSKNSSDVLGDGTVSYDPETRTVDFKDAEISQGYYNDDFRYVGVLSYDEITVTGKASMEKVNYGIVCGGKVTLDKLDLSVDTVFDSEYANAAIQAEGTVEIKDSKVSLNGNVPADLDAEKADMICYGISSYDLYVSGSSEVSVEGYVQGLVGFAFDLTGGKTTVDSKQGINCFGLFVSGEETELSVTSEGTAVECYANISVSEASVYAKGEIGGLICNGAEEPMGESEEVEFGSIIIEDAKVEAYGKYNGIEARNKVSISGQDSFVKASGIQGQYVEIKSGTVESDTENDYGINGAMSLSIGPEINKVTSKAAKAAIAATVVIIDNKVIIAEPAGGKVEKINGAFDTITLNGEIADSAVISHKHVLKKVDAKDPTLTSDGNKAYYVCDICGEWFEDEEGTKLIEDHDSVIIPKLKPTPTLTQVPTKEPTKEPTKAPTKAPTVTPTTAPATPTPTSTPKAKILEFVKRIYIYVLDREPEENGAVYWSNELWNFNRTGAEVAQGFIFSPEFEARNTSDKEFITILYKTFFGRDPDEAGMKFWLTQLSSGAMDRVTIANGFIYSQEWADTCADYGILSGGDLKPQGAIEPTEDTYAFVKRMYNTALGRGYDEPGLEYWAGLLANFETSGELVGANFFLSAEMESYNLSDKEFLNRLYLTFMDREPDEDGETYWLGIMASGASRSDIVFGFTRSPEFSEKCVEARIIPYFEE